MSRSENIQTEQILFRNIYAQTYIHVTTVNEKKVTNLKEGEERYMGGLEGDNGGKEVII